MAGYPAQYDALISAAVAKAAEKAAAKFAPARKAAPIKFTPIMVGRTPVPVRKGAPAPNLAKPTPQLDDTAAAQTAQDETAFLTGKSVPPHRLQRLVSHGQTPSARIGASMALGRF
jgi:hypothetical protein